jgi:hypothetical protein
MTQLLEVRASHVLLEDNLKKFKKKKKKKKNSQTTPTFPQKKKQKRMNIQFHMLFVIGRLGKLWSLWLVLEGMECLWLSMLQDLIIMHGESENNDNYDTQY